MTLKDLHYALDRIYMRGYDLAFQRDRILEEFIRLQGENAQLEEKLERESQRLLRMRERRLD